MQEITYPDYSEYDINTVEGIELLIKQIPSLQPYVKGLTPPFQVQRRIIPGSFPPQNRSATSLIQLLDSPGGTPRGWEDFFSQNRKLIQQFDEGIKRHNMPYYPRLWEIFRAFHELPSYQYTIGQVSVYQPCVKAVWIGQDPYFTEANGEPTAMGMSFSVRSGHKTNPSLQNIFKRMLETEVLSRVPKSGELTPLAHEGVFLLNMALTVPRKQAYLRQFPKKKSPAGAYVQQWRSLTQLAVKHVVLCNSVTVFMLWGREAQKLRDCLQSCLLNKHYVLESSHPSPLGAFGNDNLFSQCDHFRQTNAFLEDHGLTPIHWDILNKN